MPEWKEYLQRFHDNRSGITEEVLQRSTAGDHSPYRWLARSVASRVTTVLDIACGSGAMTRELEVPGRTIIGLDISAGELAEAQQRSDGPWVRADGLHLPIANDSIDSVVSAFGLPLIRPTEDFLKEISRVLKPGGLFCGLVPTIRPLSLSDIRISAAIVSKLRTQPRFPTTIELASGALLAGAGLRKLEDRRQLYHFPVRSRADAELVLTSLYLPNTPRHRIDDALDWLRGQVVERGEVLVPIPLRRIEAIKHAR